MSSNFYYSFPAIKGRQAGREYFIMMCPLNLISKLLYFDEDELPPEYRAQRVLNKARIPEIADYILGNPTNYVFSSLTASVDGKLIFEPYNDMAFGTLKISMDSRFLLNDGQHRKAAIEEALKINPDLANETISIVLFQDYELEKSQQMFADLNKHAVNTTRSIGILYESRDPMAILTKQIVNNIEMLSMYTDKENSSLSKFSPKIFTLSNIYNTNCRLLKKGQKVTNKDKDFVWAFWNLLCDTILEWNRVKEKKLTASELRRNYVISYGIVLESIGNLTHYLYSKKYDWPTIIAQLKFINWSRENLNDWQGRVFDKNGRIRKSKTNLMLTTIRLKELLKVPLETDEVDINFRGDI